MVGSDHDSLTRSHLIQPALVAPCKESFPIAVELDTSKVQQRFGSLGYPTHATTVEPFSHHIARRSLNNPC